MFCIHMPTQTPSVYLNKIKFSLTVNSPGYFYEDVELLIEFEAQQMLRTPTKCCFSYILSIYICVDTYKHSSATKVILKISAKGFLLPKLKNSSHELKTSAIPERKHCSDATVNTNSD